MPTAVSVALAALATAGLCSLGPAIVGRLPGPRSCGDHDDSPPFTASPYVALAARSGVVRDLSLAGLVVGALVGWLLAGESAVLAWVYLSAVGVVLGWIDWRTRLLPTRIIGPSYGVVVALLLTGAVIDGSAHALVRSVLGWLVMGGFYWLMWFVYPRGLGYGDVRLSGLLGLALGYVGWGTVLTGMYSAFLLGALGGGLLVASRLVDRRHLPFGPFMMLGSLVGLAWGPALAHWYLSR